MKKFSMLAVFLLCGMLVLIPKVSAQDVYAVTERNGGRIIDHYVMTDKIQSQGNAFVVGVHAVGQNFNKNEYWTVPFAYFNGEWHWAIGGNLATAIAIRKIDDPMLQSVIYGIFKKAREYI